VDDFDKLLLDYIVAISAPTFAPHFAALISSLETPALGEEMSRRK